MHSGGSCRCTGWRDRPVPGSAEPRHRQGDADAGRDRWGPQSAAARSPRLRLLSMTSGDNTAGQRPACPSMLAQRPWTRRPCPSPLRCSACLLAQRQDRCTVPRLQPVPPDLQDTRARPCWPGPMLWGALLGVPLQTTGRFSSWESGRWGVRFGAFSVKGHIVSILFHTESLATVGTQKGP